MGKIMQKKVILLTVVLVLVISSIFIKYELAINPVNLLQGLNIWETQEKVVDIEVNPSQNLGGTVDGGGRYEIGEEVTIVANPHSNYNFVGWEENGEIVSQREEYKFYCEQDTYIQAVFKLDYDKIGESVFIDGSYLLALVTKDTNIGNYHPDDLVELPKHVLARPQWSYFLRQEAAEQLEKMWTDAKAQNITLYVASAFRSYETQQQVFGENVVKYGEKIANQRSARPGESEHQLGTAVDFSEDSEGRLVQSFEDTPAGKWLKDNAYKYGFAMSYPEGYEDVTGYIYEPWHYRYIGVDSAKQWYNSNKPLSEFLKQHPQRFVRNNERASN